MNEVLALWNAAPVAAARAQIFPCCGSTAWAREMTARRPFQDEAVLTAASDDIWRGLCKSDWLEAFRSHPRIGESGIGESRRYGLAEKSSEDWAMGEQEKVADAEHAVKIALAEGNREYEKKFGHIFIVCATGKSGAEILRILTRRINNDADTELHEAAEQQRQITQIRLRKWLER
jgi:2-oxo-4-hydroxy-4-carboxy-5-ureidoimidazoline decarboxylase